MLAGARGGDGGNGRLLEGPLYRLEAEGFECVVADAKQVKNLPGRPKRDPADSRSLAACLERGSVTPCFVATPGGWPADGGKAKAQVALGNTQLKVYHKLLSNPGMRYEDLGPDYYERRRDLRRQVADHVGKLGSLGFEVTLARIPEPGPRRTRPDPGRLTHTALPQALTGIGGQGPAAACPANLLFRVRCTTLAAGYHTHRWKD